MLWSDTTKSRTFAGLLRSPVSSVDRAGCSEITSVGEEARSSLFLGRAWDYILSSSSTLFGRSHVLLGGSSTLFGRSHVLLSGSSILPRRSHALLGSRGTLLD